MTGGPPGFVRRAPVDLPAPFLDDPIAREPMWYEFGAGADEPSIPPWTWDDEPPMNAHVAPPPPAAVRHGTHEPLPFGTMDLLERAPYPGGRILAALGPDDRLRHALVASFGVQWHDPENAYKVHRGYASPRCLYPVQAFVDDGARWQLLQPERHALTTLVGGTHSGRSRRIVLTGRYTRIPRGYRWFRGSLVNLELGITLRALSIGLELFGLSGRLRLPDRRSRDQLVELGLVPSWDWSLPLTVELGEAGPAPAHATAAGGGDSDGAPDAFMADLVRVNRAQDFDEPPMNLGAAIPTGAAATAGTWSWAELMWQRNSGRMPRGMLGMNGKRRRLPGEAVRDAVRWLTVPPPTTTLRNVFDAVTISVVLQNIDGFTDGLYRVRDGEPMLHRADPAVAAKLEQQYGYPLTPEAGCDIRHASMLWYLSARPRELFASLGPGGWSAAQYVCGWVMHGLCLAATAAGLFARPVRAFREFATQHILGLEPDEMIVLGVVAGTPRHINGDVLDLRL